jgi:hypothetical protein
MGLVVYCADIGSVPRGRFGWARGEHREDIEEQPSSGTDISDLADSLAADVAADRPVALGFECPLFVPVPDLPNRLGAQCAGEGTRTWSAGAGAGAMATGIVEVAWLLRELRGRVLSTSTYLDWAEFTAAGQGLFLWEAFVSNRAKDATHVQDATDAVDAFQEALPDVMGANAVTADAPLSLLGAAMLWSGWSENIDLLHKPCLVIKADSEGRR